METNLTINLGLYDTNKMPGYPTQYQNLIPGSLSFGHYIPTSKPEFSYFVINYYSISYEQIKEAIQTWISHLESIKITKPCPDHYHYIGGLIKQLLALTSLADHLNLITKSETQVYLDKLTLINDHYFIYDDNSDDDDDTPLTLDITEIQTSEITYGISFKW